jgi:hypothetical protein
MSHRIREAMKSDATGLMGGNGGAVEADETFIGNDPQWPIRKLKRSNRTIQQMNKVMTLVDRETGRASSRVIKDLRITTIAPILEANVSPHARLMTDEANQYVGVGWNFADHGRVNHSAGEYVSRQDTPSTRTRSRASTASSNAECEASTSTADRSIFNAMSPSSTSGTPTGLRSGLMTAPAPTNACGASLGNA